MPETQEPIQGMPAPRDGGPARDMTVRDVFAAHALAGMLADSQAHGTPGAFGLAAYALADAMLAERAKRGGA